MVKFLSFLCFTFLIITSSFAADIKYEIKKDRMDFNISFQKGYSNLDILRSPQSVIFSFETTEDIVFKRKDFFDLPISSAYITSTDTRKKFIITFEKEMIEPSISESDKMIAIAFAFPQSFINQQTVTAVPGADAQKTPALPGSGAYFRMIFGLVVVLCVILLIYYLMKSYFKKQVFTDIPGSGRLLGKIDLDIRKSLYFYEIGEVVYIIGITDNSMVLIDKITDETEAINVKSGLSKKKDFAGYMNFFKRKSRLDDDMNTSNTLVEEKLKSLRKK